MTQEELIALDRATLLKIILLLKEKVSILGRTCELQEQAIGYQRETIEALKKAMGE